MKVYVLLGHVSWEGYTLVGVFSTRCLAEAFANNFKNKDAMRDFDSYDVVEQDIRTE